MIIRAAKRKFYFKRLITSFISILVKHWLLLAIFCKIQQLTIAGKAVKAAIIEIQHKDIFRSMQKKDTMLHFYTEIYLLYTKTEHSKAVKETFIGAGKAQYPFLKITFTTCCVVVAETNAIAKDVCAVWNCVKILIVWIIEIKIEALPLKITGSLINFNYLFILCMIIKFILVCICFKLLFILLLLL